MAFSAGCEEGSFILQQPVHEKDGRCIVQCGSACLLLILIAISPCLRAWEQSDAAFAAALRDTLDLASLCAYHGYQRLDK